MRTSLLASLLLGGLLLTAAPRPAAAQSNANNSIPWLTVQNQALMVQNGAKLKPVGKDVALPNGTRVEFRTRTVVLANGSRLQMKEGDMLSLNGEFIHKAAAAEPVAAVSKSRPASSSSTAEVPAA